MFTRFGRGIMCCAAVSLCVTNNQALGVPSIVAGTNGLANTTFAADTTTSSTASTPKVISVLIGRCKTLLNETECSQFANADDGRIPDDYHYRIDGPAPPGCFGFTVSDPDLSGSKQRTYTVVRYNPDQDSQMSCGKDGYICFCAASATSLTTRALPDRTQNSTSLSLTNRTRTTKRCPTAISEKDECRAFAQGPGREFKEYDATIDPIPFGCAATNDTSSNTLLVMFNSVPDYEASHNPAECGEEYFCICAVSKSTPPPDNGAPATTEKHNFLNMSPEITVAALAFCVAIFMATAIVLWRRQKHSRARSVSKDDALQVPLFSQVDHAFQIPLSKLQIGKVIARGANGQIRKGTFGGVPVAIKELLSTLLDPGFTDGLRAEASMLCSMHHPNIVRFYGMAVDPTPKRGTLYYLVTDLKDKDLRKVIDAEPQPSLDELLRMAMEICAPLEFLHSVNMVHRDLKPGNILLDHNRTLFLCDFGISKAFNPDATNIDMTLNVGTASYMAPELSNLSGFVMQSSPSFGDRLIAADDRQPQEEREQRLATKHSTRLDDEELTEVAPSPMTTEDTLREMSSALARSDTIITTASKVDCYSYAMVLWVLMAWQLPYRKLTVMQILCAASMYNKRPSTKDLVELCPPAVLKLMRSMWALDPKERPTMMDARKTLEQVIKDTKDKNTDETSPTSSDADAAKTAISADNIEPNGVEDE